MKQNEFQLTTLNQLRESFNDSQQRIDLQYDSLHSNLSPLLIDTDLDKTEREVAGLIEKETISSGLFNKISSANKSVLEQLDEIKFFGSSSSYLTGFFSSEFSKKDKEKWDQIENTLAKIYNQENGLVRQIQDHFLFKIDSTDLAKLLNKESLTLEEDLFIRTILIKGYLVNFRQLILPFYEIDDRLLIKFKKERISWLERHRTHGASTSQLDEEIDLLNSQIKNLEYSSSLEVKNTEKFNEKISVANQNISNLNIKLNTGSVILGTAETTRYLTSFIGHRANIDTFKYVGNFGFKTGSLFAKCLPFISVITEAGTQMNNNRIIFNYEKQLKTISVIEDVKRSLLTLEHQATNHYFDNILSRLQKSMINSNIKIARIINYHYQEHLAEKGKRTEITKLHEEVQREYRKTISTRDNENRKRVDVKDTEISNLKCSQAELNYEKKKLILSNKKLQEENEELKRVIIKTQENLDFTSSLLQEERELFLDRRNNDLVIENIGHDDLKSKLDKKKEDLKFRAATESIMNENCFLKNGVSGLESSLKSLWKYLADVIDSGIMEYKKIEAEKNKLLGEKIELSDEIHQLRNIEIDLIFLEKVYSERDAQAKEYEENNSRMRLENVQLESDNRSLKSTIFFGKSLFSEQEQEILNLKKNWKSLGRKTHSLKKKTKYWQWTSWN